MLEYNTGRNKLIIKEYGRNVQKMIEDAIKIEDRNKRNEAAKAIVRVMSQAVPIGTNNNSANTNLQNSDPNKKQKESIDYWRKLWDHLVIISNYQLDVDSPFPKPAPEAKVVVLNKNPKIKKPKIAMRTYGRYMEKIIKTVSNYPDSELKTQLTQDIANQLKKLYLTWNRDTVEDKLILQQLSDLSNGRLKLPKNFVLNSTQDIIQKNNLYAAKPKLSKSAKRKKKKHKNPVEII